MPYSSFPILNRRISYGIREKYIDTTIRTSLGNGGYESTRAGATRLRKEFDTKYSLLEDKDLDLLKVFELSIMIGSNAFYWSNPKEAYGRLEWEADEVLLQGQIRRPTVSNGHSYVAAVFEYTGACFPSTLATL